LVLVAINVVIYGIQTAVPGLTERYGLTRFDVEAGQYERLVTSAFLHASVLHLASNMLALYIVGAPLERAIGSVRLGVVYLASALGGSFLALALSPPYALGVGASGAIYGLFGAVAVLHRRVGADLRGIGMLILLNLAISFAIPNISWQAHIGGLVTGAAVAAVVSGRRPRRSPTPPSG
ncbi:MAG TPA: rhomboid family intramembrane serine protease, partial [Mycobacteriales bacterium]|nr:rhomboid family intramembrane serine protease [Mycobacteriales bacterium]